jgi:hypothetical protein
MPTVKANKNAAATAIMALVIMKASWPSISTSAYSSLFNRCL